MGLHHSSQSLDSWEGDVGQSGAREPGVRVFWKVNGGGTKCREKFY